MHKQLLRVARGARYVTAPDGLFQKKEEWGMRVGSERRKVRLLLKMSSQLSMMRVRIKNFHLNSPFLIAP